VKHSKVIVLTASAYESERFKHLSIRHNKEESDELLRLWLPPVISSALTFNDHKSREFGLGQTLEDVLNGHQQAGSFQHKAVN